jgi:aldose 1-epimerase
MAYRISTSTAGGRTVHHLHDDAAGSSASVIPSYGFNLFDLRLPAGGEPRRILDAAADFAANPRSAGRNGWPVLFPFPNRIAGGAYTFEERSFKLPQNNGPNAIHGFAIDAPWDVVGHRVTSKGAEIEGRYQLSTQSPSAVEMWPTDAVLELKYTLAGRKLTLEAVVTNPTARRLPVGLGFHPYFRLPLREGGDQARTRVILPAHDYWVLQDFLPTGEVKPVDKRLDFREGQPIAGLQLDDVLTGIRHDGNGQAVCRLVDEDLGAEVRFTVDAMIRELVVYTPPGPGGVISIEPYTQATDAIHLAARGIDGGLRILEHGERFQTTMTVETLG